MIFVTFILEYPVGIKASVESSTDLVPYFDQEPVSYISYPPIEDHHINFEILLSLKPETTDGKANFTVL